MLEDGDGVGRFAIGSMFPWGIRPSRSLRIVPVAYVSPSSRHFTDLAGRRLGKPQSLTPFPFFFPLNPPSGSASRRQPFDLAGEVTQLTMRFLQVVVGLQTQPEALAGTQRQRHADGGVRGDPTLAEDDFVDPARRDVHRARQRVLADAERAEELLQQDFTGMDIGATNGVRRTSLHRFTTIPEAPDGVEPGWATGAQLRPLSHTRSEEHTSELQSLMRISYAVFCLKKKNT